MNTMHKILAFAVLAGITAACNSATTNSAQSGTPTNTEIKKDKMDNQEIVENGTKMWIGEIDRASLDNADYPWYETEEGYHTVNTAVVDDFKSDLKDYDIEIYMGTWCSDSQREVPAFYKIMDAAGYPENRIRMYALDRSKNTPSGIEDKNSVAYVPTFIFYKNGIEAGRIVESPINSLEEDIRDIVNGTPQTPNYAQ